MTHRDDTDATDIVTPIRNASPPERAPTERHRARGEVRVLLPDEPPPLTPPAAPDAARRSGTAAARSERGYRH